jgi:Fe-S-cluster containining protein
MADSISFQCIRCGKCCNPDQIDAETLQYIPIYLDEVDEIIRLATQHNLKIDLEPDLMYFDELNEQLIIVTYTLRIDNGGCPFYHSSCMIYNQRPITCKAYPLSIFQSNDTTGITLKPECSFVQKYGATLKKLDYYEMSDVFSNEFPFSREIQIKGKAITDQIVELENKGKIRVPVKLPVEITDEIKTMKKVRLDKITV